MRYVRVGTKLQLKKGAIPVPSGGRGCAAQEVLQNALDGLETSIRESVLGQKAVKYAQPLLALLGHGTLDLSPLITHRMALGDTPSACELFRNRVDGVLKIALIP